jgi:DNA-binding transcriptional LysR family regulator
MIDDIELRQLRAVRAVAAEGSFGRAAERLGFTQSAISQQIAGLERAVGERVFDRPGGPRRVELTPAGTLLLRHAEAMLAELGELEDNLRSLRAGEVGRLMVGSFQSISVRVLPEVIGRLRSERPGLTVRATEDDDNDTLIARLLADEVDLSFLSGPTDHPGLEAVELMTDPFVLLSPADEPLAVDARGNVDVTMLDRAPLIGETPCSCQAFIENELRRHSVQADFVFRTNDNAAIQAMVRAGMGHAVVPFLCVDVADRGVVARRLHPEFAPRRLVLARRRGRTLIPAANRFVELAVDVCAALPRFGTTPVTSGSTT